MKRYVLLAALVLATCMPAHAQSQDDAQVFHTTCMGASGTLEPDPNTVTIDEYAKIAVENALCTCAWETGKRGLAGYADIVRLAHKVGPLDSPQADALATNTVRAIQQCNRRLEQAPRRIEFLWQYRGSFELAPVRAAL